MKNKILIVVVFLFTITTTTTAQNKKHKIVFQFTNANDTLQQKAFVKQLENLTTHWPKALYEVVIYNQGLELVMIKNTTYTNRLLDLHKKGVNFVVCENTLKNRNISKDAFDNNLVTYVEAGIAEIIEKQEKGWKYIKGGF